MKFIADLHIHSHYSRATSKGLTLPELYRSALGKGIHVIGTGDFTHPGWMAEIKEQLVPAPEPGLYCLRKDLARTIDQDAPAVCHHPVRFLLSVEISSIYKKNGRTRKVHNVVFAPDIATAECIYHRLAQIGNLKSDGRPILGLDSKHLLEILLEISEQAYLIPAHIWTPWFSVLGAKSGFDDIEECFEDLTEHIFAVETGLSSDPAMNWRCSRLDRFALVSNSDAHSPGKLGREANLFDSELSYPDIFEALHENSPGRFLGTVEFYPEEGKYYYDGHRKCQVRLDPEDALLRRGICPVCGKPVTIGVMHRIAQLADRKGEERPAKARPYQTLVGLETILAEIEQVGPQSKKVRRSYQRLLSEVGPELEILRRLPLSEIERHGSPLLAEAVRRVRVGQLEIAEGYDGEYGTIRIFAAGERQQYETQGSFFFGEPGEAATVKSAQPEPKKKLTGLMIATKPEPKPTAAITMRLDDAQQRAVDHHGGPLLVLAGPGSGKTHTLTTRIEHLVRDRQVSPQQILAITFTNKAAREMRQRLERLSADDARAMTICTFHCLGLSILRQHGDLVGLPADFVVYSALEIAGDCLGKEQLEEISALKTRLVEPEDAPDSIRETYLTYQQTLTGRRGVDIDDLVRLAVKVLEQHQSACSWWQSRFTAVAVDEYQDLNYGQYRLLRAMLTENHDLCVIGDADQAIYGFRGADPAYFLRFPEDFNRAARVELTRNYRCPANILEAARAVICHNPGHIELDIAAEVPAGEKIRIYQAPTEKAEAEFVVHTIERLLGGTTHFSLDSERSDGQSSDRLDFGSFAVLYRLHRQANAIEEALVRSGMPYRVAGGNLLWQSPQMQAWKNLMALVVDSRQDARLASLLPGLPGVGQQTMAAIVANAETINRSLWDELSAAQLKIPAPAQSAINRLLATITEWRRVAPSSIIDLLALIRQELPSPVWKLSEEQWECLVGLAANVGDLRELLETCTLSRDSDDLYPPADKISVMSLHAAKGLEFPVVFIVGCEDGLLPYRPDHGPVAIEEERRLFYVGLTRASAMLYLLHSKKRIWRGRNRPAVPSPFLEEILADLLEPVQIDWSKKRRTTDRTQQMEWF